MAHETDPGFTMLLREIQQFREDVKDDFAQVRDDIRTYVPRGEYEENKKSVDRRLGVIEKLLYGVTSTVVIATVMVILGFKGVV